MLKPTSAAWAVIAGATLAALLHACLFPGQIGAEFLGVKFLLVGGGDLTLAALLALLWLLVARSRPATPAAAFWMGAALGLGPLLAGWLLPAVLAGPAGAAGMAGRMAGLALTGLLLFLLPRGLRRAPPVGACAAVAVAGLSAWSLLYAGFGVADELPLPPLPPAARAAGAGPDVVLVSIDTLRADALHDPTAPTPALEAWAARGARADFALAPSPSTVPSHITMLSGRSPLRHGAWHNWDPVPADLPMLAERLRAAGWRTTGIVSNPLLVKEQNNGFERGFELFLDARRRRDAFNPWTRTARMSAWATAREATWQAWLLPRKLCSAWINLLAERRRPPAFPHEEGSVGRSTLAAAEHYLSELQAGAAPYFLFLHFHDPHFPYAPDPSVAGTLCADCELPSWFRELEEQGLFQAALTLERMLADGEPRARELLATLHDLYREEVRFVDDCMARLLERVDAGGRPTVLLFTSDHGEQFGEHDRLFHGNTLYEPLLQVPFLLAAPGVEAGTTLPRRPRLEDVAPTLLGLCELPPAPDSDGIDLLGVVDRETESQAGPAAAAEIEPHFALMAQGFALRREGWKLTGSCARDQGRYVRVEARELFHLSSDPEEQRNRLPEQPERAAVMLEEARALLGGAVAGQEVEVPPDFRAALEEMGYVDAAEDAD